MVDTVKILGALLGGGNMSSGSGASILKSVLGAAVSGGQQSGGGGGLGDLLGSVMKGAGGQQSGGGGLGDILGSVLGGGGQKSGGGLGDVLGSVLGGGSNQSAQQQSGGGLGDLIGGVLGGGSNQAAPQQQSGGGGLSDLLGGILGGAKSQGGSGGGADLSDLIGSALNQFGHAEKAAQSGGQPRSFEEHSPGMVHGEACEQATIMVRAMINAAKADGRVDKEEQKKILGKLGSVTQDEIDFVNSEIAAPLDIQGFARSIPRGMENQGLRDVIDGD